MFVVDVFLFLSHSEVISTIYNLYWMQNICEPELCHIKSRREDGKGKGGAQHPMLSHMADFPSLLIPRLAPTCVFVTVNEAQRYVSYNKYT
jgi:hypothetical protein